MARSTRLPFQRRDLPSDIGAVLRGARERSGRSRRHVAGEASIAPRTLARIERGDQAPTWPTLERLCGVLDLSTFSVARRWASDAMDQPDSYGEAPGLLVGALRRQRGLTLARLAELVGVSAATLSRFERGMTASRLLTPGPGAADGLRAGGRPRDGGQRLSRALGFKDFEAFRQACRAPSAVAGADLDDGPVD